MGLINLVKKNRSYRRFFENYRISQKTLRGLINLARLSASAANLQPLKFLLANEPSGNNLIFPALAWAGYLTDWPGPEKGERPAAYIVILGNRTISKFLEYDSGIASQSILLGATEKKLGGCILGALNRELLRKNFSIPKQYEILLVIALGKPKEKVLLNKAVAGNIKYYRDSSGTHHVPKKALKEVIYVPDKNRH